MYYNIFHEENIKVKKEDKDNFTEVGTLVQNLQTLITTVEGMQESNQETFKKQLSDLIPKLNVEIEVLHEASLNEAFLSGQSNMFDMSRQLDELEAKLNDLESLSAKYNNWQEVLSMNPTSSRILTRPEKTSLFAAYFGARCSSGRTRLTSGPRPNSRRFRRRTSRPRLRTSPRSACDSRRTWTLTPSRSSSKKWSTLSRAQCPSWWH